MSTSETVKKIRINMCLEQSEFAKVLGISTSSVSLYEQGKRKPRLPLVKKMRELAKQNGMEFKVEDFLS